jgi:hypothetical protein
MPGSAVHHNPLGMESSVRTQAGSRTRTSRTGDFGGFRRRIAGSVRSRIAPCCEAHKIKGDQLKREMDRVLRSGFKVMLTPGGALAGQATGANKYVKRVGYVTGVGCAVKDRL